MDRRTFLWGSAGVAVAGALSRLGLAPAGAQTSPTTLPPATPPPPPSLWPPTLSAYDGLTAEWVLAENALAGDEGWKIGGREQPGERATAKGAPTLVGIEGYLDTTSAALGERIAFRVSSTAASYRIQAYRMGWYQGLGGRLVWESNELPGWRQSTGTYDDTTNMAEAGWDTSFELTLDHPPFLPGCYVFRLSGDDGATRLVPLTVRDDHSRARFLLVNAVTDWQAYNEWGGASLYYGTKPTGRSRNFGNRARVVSFDRPYDWGQGAGDFIGAELPLIMRIEEAGLDVAYMTGIDVHENPARLLHHTAVLSTAHDEYWSAEMRTAFEGARDASVNLAFFGANAMYRQIRLEDTLHGRFRHEVCYKSAGEDPIRQEHPELTTVNWRDSPVSRPEASIIGVQYNGQGTADLVITNPDGWIWEGANVSQGQHLRGVVGPEFDMITSDSPENIEVFARSPIDAKGTRPRDDPSQAPNRPKREPKTHGDTTYYSAPSGSGVFATGTIGWIDQLNRDGSSLAPVQLPIYQATMNVLRLFGAGPAGTARPSVPNGR